MASNHEHILPRTKVLKDQYRHRRVDKRQEPSVRAVVNLHPSIFLSLSEVWLWRQQAMGRVFQTYPATLSSSSWEIQGHSQVRWDIPSREVLGSTLQVSSRLDIPWKCPIEVAQEDPDRRLLSSALQIRCMSRAEARESSFRPLVFPISFFRSIPRSQAHGWGSECRLTGDSIALPSGSVSVWTSNTSTTPTLLPMLQQNVNLPFYSVTSGTFTLPSSAEQLLTGMFSDIVGKTHCIWRSFFMCINLVNS